LPDPLQVLTNGSVQVLPDGSINATNKDAAQLIEVLGLDSDPSREFRMLWIGIVALAAKHDPNLHKMLMGFPSDLPNLARLRPPGGNMRPKGVAESCYLRKQMGNLPQTY